MVLSQRQQEMCAESKWDFTDLKALFLNCTLKLWDAGCRFDYPNPDYRQR